MQVLLIDFSMILFFGLCAQWIAWRFKAPALLFYLLFGLGLGPVFGVVHSSQIPARILEPMVALVVAVILFEGSLNLNFNDLKKSGKVIILLLTLGFLITWTGITLGGHAWLGLDWKMSALLGAILAVTGPTAVLPVLKQIRLEKSLAAILKWEALAIDPLGALFAILVFQAVTSRTLDQALWSFLLGLLKTGLLGTGLGIAAAFGLSLLMRRFWLAYALQGAGTLMILVVVFTGATLLQDEATGFFAVAVMGLVLANQKQIAIHHILEFKENLAILLIPALFITLASRITWPQLQVFNWKSLWFLLWIIVIVRPVSVWLSTLGSSLPGKARLFLAGMAPRGIVAAAVASVFAIRLQEKQMAQAGELLPLTLWVVIGTVVVYSLAAVPFSRLLGVALKDNRGVLIFGIHAFSLQFALQLKKEGVWCILAEASESKVLQAKKLGLNACACDVRDEKLFELPELARVGYFLALTQNDEANTLAALHFKKHFEQANIFQLPLKAAEGVLEKSAQGYGRFLFQSGAVWEYLEKMMSRGGRFLAVQDGEDRPGPGASGEEDQPIPLFAVRPGLELSFSTVDSPLNPGVNGTMYYLAPRKSVLPARLASYWMQRWKTRKKS